MTIQRVLALLLAFIAIGSFCATAHADKTFTYGDYYVNWPGYPESPYPVITADHIGTHPLIEGAIITTDDAGYLKSIQIQEWNFRSTQTLFINTQWDAKMSAYDAWDYFVGYGATPALYSVANTYTYSLVVDPLPDPPWPQARVGHPYGIESGITETSGILTGLTIDPGVLPAADGTGGILGTATYTFRDGSIQLFAPNSPRFVVGVSAECGNDVFLTPVPEPATVFLLGLGLLAMAVGARRGRKLGV